MPKCIDCTMHLWSYGQERVKAQLRQLRRLARNDVPQPWTRETKQILEVLEVADFPRCRAKPSPLPPFSTRRLEAEDACD